MPKFQIVDSFAGPPPRLLIDLLVGDLEVGDTIDLYETRHLVPMRIIEKRLVISGLLELTVDKKIPWDHQWQGAYIDTDDPRTARAAGYGSMKKR